MRTYNYIYYKLNQSLLIFTDSPRFATLIILCWLFLFNTFTLIDFIIADKQISGFFDNQVTVFYTLVIIGFHFLYFNKQLHERIEDRFNKESKLFNTLGFIIAGLYVFLSVFIFFKYTVPVMQGILLK